MSNYINNNYNNFKINLMNKFNRDHQSRNLLIKNILWING